MGLEASLPRRTYACRAFSHLLPAGESPSVGQLWAVDPEAVAEFLKQFHPHPSMRLLAKGRRAGPDGAFGVLRAASPTHLDVLIRAHAEFDLRPDDVKAWSRAEAWYSPACFLGRLVVNRRAGTVAYFRLGLPAENPYNVHVSLATGCPNSELHGWMRVERMELLGGNPAAVEAIRWAEQIEGATAYERLAKVFFTFKEIDWVPFDRVAEVALARRKPICAVVAMGELGDQTC